MLFNPQYDHYEKSYTRWHALALAISVGKQLHHRLAQGKDKTRSRTIPRPVVPFYIFQTLASTTILVFQCYEFHQTYLYATESLPHSRWVPEWMVDSRLLALLLSWTYVIEVFYRVDLKPFTKLHHILAQALMTYLCYRTEADQLTVWRDIGMFWLLQGTTEQLTYLALIGLKLGWNRSMVSKLLYVSSVQTGTIKLFSLLAVAYAWKLDITTLAWFASNTSHRLDPRTQTYNNRVYHDTAMHASLLEKAWIWLATEGGMWVFAMGLFVAQVRSSPIGLARKLSNEVETISTCSATAVTRTCETSQEGGRRGQETRTTELQLFNVESALWTKTRGATLLPPDTLVDPRQATVAMGKNDQKHSASDNSSVSSLSEILSMDDGTIKDLPPVDVCM